MRLTLLYRGKNTRWLYKLSKRQFTAGLIAVCALVLMSSRSTDLPSEEQSRIAYARAGFELQQKQVNSLKSATEQRLTGVMLKLADMQSQLLRLDALGARLVEQAKLNPGEFSFGEEPAVGGPHTTDVANIEVNDQLLVKMDSMLEQIHSKTQELHALESIMLNHHINQQSVVKGKPLESGWLSSYYGIRKDPFSGLPAMHKGLDFAGKEGEPVLSTGAGLVIWSGERYGYGNLVEIEHGNGLVTRYGHNKQLNVKMGDVVTKGQPIALMGNTGRSTGAHVHYEVLRKGRQQDPLPYVY